MVSLLNSTLADREDAALRAMFAARKSVFVDLLKWDLPVADGTFEIDQFDDEHARYLILLGDAGQHLASARLLPTDRPHILDSLFAELCERPVPQDAFTFEITSLGTCAGAFSCEQPEHTRQPPGHTGARFNFRPNGVLTPRRHPTSYAVMILS